MKKLAYIAISLILVLQIGGMVLILKLQQCMVQLEMKAALSNDATRYQTISLSLTDFKQKINENEILIDGKLYDVSSYSIKGNTIQLLVMSDEKEENILEKIKEFTTGTTKHSPFPEQMLQLLTLTYILTDCTHKFGLQQISQQKYTQLCANVFSVTGEVSSPPPKFN